MMCALPADENAHPLPQLPRLILIDGFNVMHGFKNLMNDPHVDSRMNAIVILPLIKTFSNAGFVVRIAIPRYPKPFEVNHMYILHELNKIQICIYPAKTFKEADDLIMLEIAEKYGAKIISNDAFKNHRKYQSVAQKYAIKYKKKLNPKFSLEELERRLIFKNKCFIDGKEDDMYCMLNDPDYKKVEESYDVFWQLTIYDKKILDLLQSYVHCYICSQIGFKIPSNIVFMADDENSPPKFAVFRNRNFSLNI
uniref:RNase NYN domain-containing protein n=1 Tax=Panagrolaimus sp. ES5 TaxID=591445 RepID=A0AC34F2I8_9BILA